VSGCQAATVHPRPRLTAVPNARATSSEQIVSTAVELFQRHGYQRTTIDDICRKLGIGKPTVYQYVKGKQAILEAVFDQTLKRLELENASLADAADPGPQLERLVRGYTQAVADLGTHFRVFFGDERELPPRARKQLHEFSRRAAETVAGVVRRCADAGLLRADLDPKITSFLIVGMIASVARWFDPRAPLTPDQLSEEILKLIGYDATTQAATTTGAPAPAVPRP
jgi:AcrR family transcriptional regulator